MNDFKLGDRVTHAENGAGEVLGIRIRGQYQQAWVRFDNPIPEYKDVWFEDVFEEVVSFSDLEPEVVG